MEKGRRNIEGVREAVSVCVRKEGSEGGRE